MISGVPKTDIAFVVGKVDQPIVPKDVISSTPNLIELASNSKWKEIRNLLKQDKFTIEDVEAVCKVGKYKGYNALAIYMLKEDEIREEFPLIKEFMDKKLINEKILLNRDNHSFLFLRICEFVPKEEILIQLMGYATPTLLKERFHADIETIYNNYNALNMLSELGRWGAIKELMKQPSLFSMEIIKNKSLSTFEEEYYGVNFIGNVIYNQQWDILEFLYDQRLLTFHLLTSSIVPDKEDNKYGDGKLATLPPSALSFFLANCKKASLVEKIIKLVPGVPELSFTPSISPQFSYKIKDLTAKTKFEDTLDLLRKNHKLQPYIVEDHAISITNSLNKNSEHELNIYLSELYLYPTLLKQQKVIFDIIIKKMHLKQAQIQNFILDGLNKMKSEAVVPEWVEKFTTATQFSSEKEKKPESSSSAQPFFFFKYPGVEEKENNFTFDDFVPPSFPSIPPK